MSHRPTVYGTRHAVSAGHYLAASAAFAILEAGGNAIDAGCAAGIALGVLQPDLVNVAGVAPIMIRLANGHVESIAGLGWWPKSLAADIFMREHGGKIPDGVLRTVIPAAPDAWITALERHGTMRFADVAAMWSKLLPASWNKAIWTFSPSVVPQLLQLKDGANRAIFIAIDQGITKMPNWSLLGRPAFPTEKVPALGTKGDLMLLDPSLYIIGDRMSVEIAASEHVNFLKNQMTWRVVERVDGQPCDSLRRTGSKRFFGGSADDGSQCTDFGSSQRPRRLSATDSGRQARRSWSEARTVEAKA